MGTSAFHVTAPHMQRPDKIDIAIIPMVCCAKFLQIFSGSNRYSGTRKQVEKHTVVLAKNMSWPWEQDDEGRLRPHLGHSADSLRPAAFGAS